MERGCSWPSTLTNPRDAEGGCKSELGYDAICLDIFNDLKRLFFANDGSLKYDEADFSYVSFICSIMCNTSDFLFV